MPEIQHCLPAHSREHFIRLRNSNWKGARSIYNQKLDAARRNAAARGVLRSGYQQLAEWNLWQELSGSLARGYLDAALETCHLYSVRLDDRLCECIRNAITEFLVAQKQHLLQRAARPDPGAARVPNSAIQQLAGQHNLPHLNEILIELEKARLKSIGASAHKEPIMNQTFNVTGPNARVNINSTDSSTNTVRQGIPFAEIREAIASEVADEVERTIILARLNELEAATSRESGAKKYQAFVAVAANHMAILGPYLPILGHWVHSLAGSVL